MTGHTGTYIMYVCRTGMLYFMTGHTGTYIMYVCRTGMLLAIYIPRCKLISLPCSGGSTSDLICNLFRSSESFSESKDL